MRSPLRILFITTLLLTACSAKSEATAEKVRPTTSTTMSAITTVVPSPTSTIFAPVAPTTTTSTPATYKAVSKNIWDSMCTCECGGVCNWANQEGYYEGGLQFAPSTWTSYVAAGKSYALVGYPPHAYQASREQQIVVAIRVRDGVKGSSGPYLNPQGWNAWPTCRHKVGV